MANKLKSIIIEMQIKMVIDLHVGCTAAGRGGPAFRAPRRWPRLEMENDNK